ncbi:MAG: mannitol dehydrogenase family protein [Lachnospiraceae bacterium]|nr:mannitol dehydrogenase family protein [Lachnospiraceae bacterium]
MKLNSLGIKDKAVWEAKGYMLPKFDTDAMKKETEANPEWVHFGAGNIFRAYHAALAQTLLESGDLKTGIVVAEGFDYEIVEKAYRKFEDLSILAVLKANGSIEKKVIGSIARSAILDSERTEEFEYLKTVFKKPSLKLATFTITEKGYNLKTPAGDYMAAVAKDMEEGPAKPASYIGKVASLLYARYEAGAMPIAMVSTDNCSHNGEKLFAAIDEFAKGWVKAGKADAGFKAYIEDPSKVSFPWSMIDKITPRPDASVEEMLKKDGLEELEPVITSKSTYVAPFVNAEETEYLVIEDDFPNGRPALEKAGVIFADRDTVNNVERMKVTTCLNPLHTSLAVYGCLLGYTRIYEEMKDADLVNLITKVGYVEGLPVVTDPGVINPKDFIDTVVKVRLPNPFMPDAPQRIATDTSQKVGIRFGETIKSYIALGKVNDLNAIPAALGGWLRYLLGVDDKGEVFERSTDPLLEELDKTMKNFKLGCVPSKEECVSILEPVLRKKEIFGVDLIECGLADKIVDIFRKELEGPGAVRNTLRSL